MAKGRQRQSGGTAEGQPQPGCWPRSTRSALKAAQDVLAAAVTAAKAGDLAAMSLILSRVWPARKDRPVTLDLPELRTPADLSAALGVLANSVAAGEITPAEGQAVAGVLEVQRRAIEAVDLEARVAALEAIGETKP